VVHLRIVAPGDVARKALELLTASPTVVNVVHLPGFARKPEGDMVLCDVARRDASIIMEELRQLGIARDGSISMEPVETQLSAAADAAGRAPEELTFGDAVVWEEVEARTSEETSLSINFVEFMMIAALIAAVGSCSTHRS
jgi:hypothetical protein